MERKLAMNGRKQNKLQEKNDPVETAECTQSKRTIMSKSWNETLILIIYHKLQKECFTAFRKQTAINAAYLRGSNNKII